MHKVVLFLCTGNYYRSRFAEIVFNHNPQPSWMAISKGFSPSPSNIGPISPWTIAALEQLGIRMDHRMPEQVTQEDFQTADVVIAMNEAEHRPMIAPDVLSKVVFWDVADNVHAMEKIVRRLADLRL